MYLSFKVLVLVLIISSHNGVEGCGGCGRRGGGGGGGHSRRDPINGGWSAWRDWNALPCSGGYKTNYRHCNNPAPAYGGSSCSGPSSRRGDCNECNVGNGGCDHLCRNSMGSYKCECLPGYKRNPGNKTKCAAITCATSNWPSPTNGKTTCRNQSKVNSGLTCVATCDRGFKIEGLSTSTCGIDGIWSPKKSPNCRVRECNPLSPPEKGDVTPDICKIKPLHGQKCSFVCNAGYTRIGPSFSSCDDGYWIPGSFTVCKDTQAPSFGITCPPVQNVIADRGKTTALVTWAPVKATDNEIATVTTSPEVTSPHEFPEGSHTVIYTATDPSGNTKFCLLKVNVQVLRCPVYFPPKNGRPEGSACGTVYGSVCRWQCNKGYENKGSTLRECDKAVGANQVYWTGNATYCEGRDLTRSMV